MARSTPDPGSSSRAEGHDPVRVLAPEAAVRRLTRRTFLGGTLATGLLAGCGGSDTPAATGSPAATTGQSSASPSAAALEKQLNIYTWGEYNDPQVLKDFTKTFGPKLQIDSYASNEEMIAKLVAARGTSGYDICVPTGVYIPQMSANGLLEELDRSRLPNITNVDPAFLDQPWDKGNTYSVCKDWGTTGYVYDTTKIKRKMTTWQDFIDVAQGEAAGNVSVLDDPNEVIYIHLFAKGHDPNTNDPAVLDETADVLVNKVGPNVKVFDSYPGGGAIPQSSAALLQAWNGDARQGILASKTPQKWKWVAPPEGANLWMDTWAIVKGAKNTAAAYAFINNMLDPEVSYRELDYIGYNTGIKGIEATARAKKLKLPELVFLTPERVAQLTASQVVESQQRRVEIISEMKAKAGS